MEKKLFKKNETYQPLTAQQFEDLSNELLAEVNKLTAPQFIDANYFATILTNVIHSPEQKKGKTTKLSLFEGCVALISRQLTYGISEDLRLKAETKNTEGEKQEPGTDTVLGNEAIEAASH